MDKDALSDREELFTVSHLMKALKGGDYLMMTTPLVILY